jgi:hypothetical protein
VCVSAGVRRACSMHQVCEGRTSRVQFVARGRKHSSGLPYCICLQRKFVCKVAALRVPRAGGWHAQHADHRSCHRTLLRCMQTSF